MSKKIFLFTHDFLTISNEVRRILTSFIFDYASHPPMYNH